MYSPTKTVFLFFFLQAHVYAVRFQERDSIQNLSEYMDQHLLNIKIEDVERTERFTRTFLWQLEEDLKSFSVRLSKFLTQSTEAQLEYCSTAPGKEEGPGHAIAQSEQKSAALAFLRTISTMEIIREYALKKYSLQQIWELAKIPLLEARTELENVKRWR